MTSGTIMPNNIIELDRPVRRGTFDEIHDVQGGLVHIHESEAM